MLLGPTPIGSAVCNLVRIACLEVVDRDPAYVIAEFLTMEGDPLPIGRPRRIVVEPALRRVCDLADMGTVWVHREERALGVIGIEPAAKDDLTVPGRATARVVFVIATGEHRKSHDYHH
jgi:hypothetical protein